MAFSVSDTNIQEISLQTVMHLNLEFGFYHQWCLLIFLKFFRNRLTCKMREKLSF